MDMVSDDLVGASPYFTKFQGEPLSGALNARGLENFAIIAFHPGNVRYRPIVTWNTNRKS